VDRAGRFAPLKGSLGRVLSSELAQVIATVAADRTNAAHVWRGPSAAHRISVVRPPEGEPRVLPSHVVDSVPVDDLAPLPAPMRHVAATDDDLHALSASGLVDDDAEVSVRRADGTIARVTIVDGRAVDDSNASNL
jgi:hypothetical protein